MNSIDPAVLYGRHPARCVSFDDLEAALERELLAGYVRRVSDGDLDLWTYANSVAYERAWTLYSAIARGLITDRVARRVVATPFPKFFNHGEVPDWPLPATGFEVTEKLDGSLGIVFYAGSRWRVATKGSFRSEQALWAQAWLEKNVSLDRLRPGVTYLAEVIYRANRIVVSYDFEGLALLSAYDGFGAEVPREDLVAAAHDAGLRIVSQRHDAADVWSLLEYARSMRLDSEGFVVRFAGGMRVKIKGDEYCRVHRLISRCTPLAVWEAMVAGDSLDAIRVQLPEEFRADFDSIVSILHFAVTLRRENLALAVEQCAGLTDKELGLMLAADPAAFGDVGRMVFSVRKQGPAWLDTPRGRYVLMSLFRPTGNALPGYEPTSAMNRFGVEG